MTEIQLACVGQRILVIGNPGSGKSVLARYLSTALGLPTVDLDALFWGTGWSKASDEQFLHGVRRATDRRCWIIDGVYPIAVEAVASDAEVVIWLDLPFQVLLVRVVRRSIRRIVHREVICGGNRERWRDLLGRDSMPVYLALTYRSYRRRFADLTRRSAQFHSSRVIHLRSAAEVKAWLCGDPAMEGLRLNRLRQSGADGR